MLHPVLAQVLGQRVLGLSPKLYLKKKKKSQNCKMLASLLKEKTYLGFALFPDLPEGTQNINWTMEIQQNWMPKLFPKKKFCYEFVKKNVK